MVPQGPLLHYTGPSLSEGKLPAIFYFALSGEASLCKDPYNQPVAMLAEEPLRIFSLTLPYHEDENGFVQAIGNWASAISDNRNIIQEFTESVCRSIDYLVDNGWVDEQHIAAAGLSRGGFMAAHAAAMDARIHTILGYAPLTRLTYAKEFHALQQNPLARSLDLENIVDKLVTRHIRFYIGNHDTRVGTDRCFHFVNAMVDASIKHGLRTVPVELIITSSHGQYGHGTLPHIFRDGVTWLIAQMGLNNVGRIQ
jgi:esterase FrsA